MSPTSLTFRIDDEALRAQNNILTLVRLCLASSVILTHAVWRISDQSGADWFSPWLGVPISAVAVDGFFFLSGFLVFRSLARRSLGSFMLARLARMFPGLATSVVLTALAGAWLTSAHGLDYLNGPTAKFLIGNLTFTKGYYELTGVTCGNALCNVNGSLWTLPWEMRCYLILAALSLLGLIVPRRFAAIAVVTLLGALAWYLTPLGARLEAHHHAGIAYQLEQVARLWSMFALGCAASIWYRRIPLNPWVALALLGLTVLSAHMPVAFFVRAATIGYGILYCGFRPWSFRHRIGRWPDYSYGIYIYAFPVMQLVMGAFPGLNAAELAAINLICVLPIAALSWHIVEKPVLELVRRRSLPSAGSGPLTSGA